MKLPWLTLFFQLFTWVLSAKGAALSRMEEEETLDFLLQFGYLQQPLERFSQKFTEEEIEVALRAFQLASGLPTTGQVDMETISQMRQPRCGVDDPFNERTLKYRLLAVVASGVRRLGRNMGQSSSLGKVVMSALHLRQRCGQDLRTVISYIKSRR